MGVGTRSGKRTRSPNKVRSPRSPKRAKPTLLNLPLNSIRNISQKLPANNKLSLANVLPPHMRNAIPKIKITKINESNNENIIRREREIANIFRNIRSGNNNTVQTFLRLANNYHRAYPHVNNHRPNVNINGMRRLIGKYSLLYGSGYYKRQANELRNRTQKGKTRINTNWVGPFASGDPRYKYWMSRNGTMKFYPYRTRKGTMVINGVRHKHAKNKFIFNIHGYKY